MDHDIEVGDVVLKLNDLQLMTVSAVYDDNTIKALWFDSDHHLHRERLSINEIYKQTITSKLDEALAKYSPKGKKMRRKKMVISIIKEPIN